MLLLIAVAFVAGLVTVLSPCVLPILPVVLASAAGGRRRPLAVILGLVISFAAFTLIISQLVMRLGLPVSVLRLAAIVIIGLLGLAMIVPSLNTRLEVLLSRLPGLAPQQQGDGWRAGLVTGATLGLVWAPCAGPILAAVTTLAATQRIGLVGAIVGITYSIGAGVPLLLIAYGGRAVITRLPAINRHTLAVQRIFGGLMILTAALIALNVDVALSAQAASLLPADWSNRLTAIETNSAVTSQLRQLNGPVAQAGAGSSEPSVAAPQPAAGSTGDQSSVPAPAPPTARANLPILGRAPELAGLSHWINSAPLTIAGLRGKVVIIDFWTYSCINCIRTLPYVTQWYQKYKDQGLVIIGVHSPEFSFEHDPANVLQATKMYHITYPVAQDNDLETWSAFENIYWPAEYFIDADGNLRYMHFGEGEYDQTEKIIQSLLAEAGHPVQDEVVKPVEVPISAMQTQETYLGLLRMGRFVSVELPQADKPMTWSLPKELPQDAFALGGQWTFGDEYITESEAGSALQFHFRAKDVYLVMTSDKPVTVKVSVDQGLANHSEDVDAQGKLTVAESRLYHLVSLDGMQSAIVTLQFDQPGVSAYAFTFGS